MGKESQERDVADIAAVARGDRGSLASLYDRYSGLMLGLGVRVLRDRLAAEDIVHDVFLEVWRCAGDYDPTRGSVRSWIFMRMRSRCLDRVRSAAYRRSDSLDDADEDSLRRALPAEWSGIWPDQLADRAQVRRLVSSLPEHQRQVLELGYFKGLSSTEMAQQLAIPVGTVKSRVRAAIGALRSAYEVGRE